MSVCVSGGADYLFVVATCRVRKLCVGAFAASLGLADDFRASPLRSCGRSGQPHTPFFEGRKEVRTCASMYDAWDQVIGSRLVVSERMNVSISVQCIRDACLGHKCAPHAHQG